MRHGFPEEAEIELGHAPDGPLLSIASEKNALG